MRDVTKDTSPILIVPYMWIGDFVRCHSVVMLLRQRFPNRPVDLLATTLCAPLADYMPGVRQSIVADLPRGRLALAQQWALAARFKQESYGMALIMPRTWKAALAPFLAGIPQRVGFAGEVRFALINDVRFGERKLPRMVDRCAMLALPRGAVQPPEWPMPKLEAPASEIAAWRIRHGLAPLARRSAGRQPPTQRWRASLRPTASRFGFWAAPMKNPWRPKSPAALPPAISPARIYAMRSSRLAPLRLRSQTIPGCFMSPLRSEPRRSEFSARPVRGIGRRLIRLPRSSRPRANCPAGRATSRSAGSPTTAACATSIPTRFWPRPATHWQKPRQGRNCWHNAVFIKSAYGGA